MHGLFNRALQRFLAATYGQPLWHEVVRRADLDTPEFEALLIYDDAVTRQVLNAAVESLSKPVGEILEDLGTHLVSNPGSNGVRRLLRFGGADFDTFLLSLPDLPDRGRLAMPDLDLPDFALTETAPGAYVLECRTPHPEYCHVTLGALRAMADDYGALAALEMEMRPGRGATINLAVYEARFHEGRSFALGGQVS